jgi:hypothetical protein
MMKAFALNLSEHNLRKGAYIIETAEEEEQAERIAREAAVKAAAEQANTVTGEEYGGGEGR